MLISGIDFYMLKTAVAPLYLHFFAFLALSVDQFQMIYVGRSKGREERNENE